MADFFRKIFGFKDRDEDARDGRIRSGRVPVRAAWRVEDDGRLASHWLARGSD
jgi:hypothetical protein